MRRYPKSLRSIRSRSIPLHRFLGLGGLDSAVKIVPLPKSRGKFVVMLRPPMSPATLSEALIVSRVELRRVASRLFSAADTLRR